MLFKFIACVLWIFKKKIYLLLQGNIIWLMLDIGYLNEYEYLGLHKDESYYFQDIWPREQPTIQEERFNHVYLLLRNVIDRAFIVWK
jgi:hypothetical protein